MQNAMASVILAIAKITGQLVAVGFQAWQFGCVLNVCYFSETPK